MITVAPVETLEEEQKRRTPLRGVSAPAADAAFTLMRLLNFKVREGQPIKNLIANRHCLAILIDQVSNIYHVTKIRPELYYWQRRVVNETATAPQLGVFLQKLIEALRLIQFEDQQKDVRFELSGHRGQPVGKQHVISAPALRAATGIFQCYEVSWKLSKSVPQPKQIAGVIDTTVRLYRAVRLLPVVMEYKRRLARGDMTLQDITSFFKFVGIELEYLPTYEEREEESLVVIK